MSIFEQEQEDRNRTFKDLVTAGENYEGLRRLADHHRITLRTLRLYNMKVPEISTESANEVDEVLNCNLGKIERAQTIAGRRLWGVLDKYTGCGPLADGLEPGLIEYRLQLWKYEVVQKHWPSCKCRICTAWSDSNRDLVDF